MYRSFCAILCFFLISCGNASLPPDNSTTATRNANQLKDAQHFIQTGDVILRSGKDVTSYRIRALAEQDKTYSHAGIAIVQPNGIFIYHITPPDSDEPKGDTLVRLEPLDKFLNPDKNFGFGIARFNLNGQQLSRLMAYTDSLKNSTTSFDWQFDLNSKHQMYCSEMVDNALRFATNDSMSLKRNAFKNDIIVRKVARYLHADEKIVKTRVYIPIDNIYLNQFCNLIAEYKFEE